MGRGDPGMEDIYHWDPVTGPRVAFKGPTGDTGQSEKLALLDCICRAQVVLLARCHTQNK